MGDTTVQTGSQQNQQQPNPPQGDPAGTQQNQTGNGNGATPPGQANDSDEDEPLRGPGKRALKAERERNEQLAAELKALEPLKRLAAALGNGDATQGKSEIDQLNEKFAKYEEDLAQERQGRLREKVARQFDLPDDLADLLKGKNEEELTAHAEVLKKYAPPKEDPPAKNGRPKPDRSQGGGQGAGGVSAKQQGLDEARRRFGDKTKTTT